MKSGLKKLVICILLLSGLSLFIHARPALDRSLTIYGIRGPSGMAMIKLFEEPPRIQGFNVKVEALAHADLVAARFIAGEALIGILPPNVAARIAASGIHIQVAAVIGMGMISLLTSESQIQSIDDLRGKTVELAGQGVTPDYVFRRLLLARGLRPETDVRLAYALGPPEITQSLITGRISTALLPEPFATIALSGRPDLRSVEDIQDEWRRITGGDNYPMTVLAVNGDFAAQNPQALRIILERFADSIKWTVENPAEAGNLAFAHDLGFPQAAAALAIPRSNYVFIPAVEARSALEDLFKVFLEFNPASIGNVLPSNRFYLDW